MKFVLTLDPHLHDTMDRLVRAIEQLAVTADRTEARRTQESQRFMAAYHTDRDFHHEESIHMADLPDQFDFHLFAETDWEAASPQTPGMVSPGTCDAQTDTPRADKERLVRNDGHP